MIYHGIRFTLKPGIAAEDKEAAFESLRNQGRVIPSVTSFVVGPDFGGEYEYGAIFVIEDLAGYEEYMNHPAHLNTDRIGLPLVDKFMSFDITDDPNQGPRHGPKRGRCCGGVATHRAHGPAQGTSSRSASRSMSRIRS